MSGEVSAVLHVGWHELHPDASLNFQLNRWFAYGGEGWLSDVRPVLGRLVSYDAWRDIFAELGERAEREQRILDAALHFRSAEFFMLASDPRKQPMRRRLLELLRRALGVSSSARFRAPMGDLELPGYRFEVQGARGTLVVFGGFDSYIEEFLPILLQLRDRGWSVVAFEGPGQGAVLEEQGAAMTTEWHRPVSAVLDALDLGDVTLVGISLGGCLAIRAAAFEPRVRRVVAFDVLTDFFACVARQMPAATRAGLAVLLALGAKRTLNGLAARAAASRPVSEWGLAHAMRVFGCATAYDALRAASAYTTRDVSFRVSTDVLLLAGAEDHYVPLGQLWEQARALTGARSVTCRVFTRAEQAHAHCQVGNLPLVLDTFDAWMLSFAGRPTVES